MESSAGTVALEVRKSALDPSPTVEHQIDSRVGGLNEARNASFEGKLDRSVLDQFLDPWVGGQDYLPNPLHCDSCAWALRHKPGV
jgi:hypothetical protein